MEYRNTYLKKTNEKYSGFVSPDVLDKDIHNTSKLVRDLIVRGPSEDLYSSLGFLHKLVGLKLSICPTKVCRGAKDKYM